MLKILEENVWKEYLFLELSIFEGYNENKTLKLK